MAYADITYGPSGTRLTVSGVDPRDNDREYDHMAMESWKATTYFDSYARADTTYFEWSEPNSFDRMEFAPLGGDMVTYAVRYTSTEPGERTDRWTYACGDIKAKVEHDFDTLVAPAIIREVPQSLPKAKRLRAHGIMDPKVDEFVWPRNPKMDTPPCIELRHSHTKTMPIDAVMPFVTKRGQTCFECRMRYGGDGRLRKAEVVILRREQWNIDVTFTAAGATKVDARRVA